jgi:hypothetical protein
LTTELLVDGPEQWFYLVPTRRVTAIDLRKKRESSRENEEMML